jgi:hypothetical protein
MLRGVRDEMGLIDLPKDTKVIPEAYLAVSLTPLREYVHCAFNTPTSNRLIAKVSDGPVLMPAGNTAQ